MSRKIVIVLLLLLAFLVALHQFIYWQIWFDTNDIHHETFIVALISLALGIAISKKLSS